MVHGFIPVLVASLASFVAANTDDLLTLVVFMAQVDSRTAKHYHVALGQIIGFTLVNLMCLVGVVFGKVVPADYLGLLGFLPILNGMWKLFRQVQKYRKRARSSSADSSDSDSDIEKEIEEVMLFVEHDEVYQNSPARPLFEDQNHQRVVYSDNNNVSNNNQVVDQNKKEPVVQQDEPVPDDIVGHESCGKRWLAKVVGCLRHVLHARVIEVVLVVLGDSGDSLTSSLPLFATETLSEIFLTLIIFYAATVVLCSVAYLLVRCSLIARFMQKYGAWVRPLMLIGLGIYILSDSVLGTLITGDSDDS